MNNTLISKDDSEGEVSLESLFSIGQIRLAEISVYNWGSFHGLRTIQISPDGTLITGDNGSGKSTIIDALMSLLLPARNAQFNAAAAQGDKGDRSLVSYMRGAFGSDHSGSSIKVRNKRDGAVCTGIRALYRADDGSEITLSGLFFLQSNGNTVGDVDRIYIASRRNLQLKELLDVLGNGEKRKLKQYLRDDKLLKMFDGKFSSYQEYYFKLLHIENRNAPNLLSRALGLKKIDDLTTLIRDLVLEPSSLRDDGRKVVSEFSDLVGIYEELDDAGRQVDALKDLPEIKSIYENTLSDSRRTKDLLDNVSVFIGEQTSSLWKNRVSRKDDDIGEKKAEISRKEYEKKTLQRICENRHKAYLEGGGDRIEEVKRDLDKAREDFDSVSVRAANYQEVAKKCSLDPAIKESVFVNNIEIARNGLLDIKEAGKDAEDNFGQYRGELNGLIQKSKLLENHIKELERKPGSLIDPAFQRLRAEMVESLGVEEDAFVFIGELIDVKQEEEQWRGAIERSVGGRSTTLLVPAETRSMVSKWLNSRHTGLFVRVEEVSAKSKATASFRDKGFLRKLHWKTHEYRDWLKQYLSRFDLDCVANTSELDAAEFSMTKEGLIRKERGRLEKNDSRKIDDKRYWNIGFSNKSKLDGLRAELASIAEDIDCKSRASEDARLEMKGLSERRSLFDQILNFSWKDIDVDYLAGVIELYETEIASLESADGDLHSLELQYEKAKSDVDDIENIIRELGNTVTALGVEREQFQKNYTESKKMASPGMVDWVREGLKDKIGEISYSDLDNIGKIMSSSSAKIQSEYQKLRDLNSGAETNAVGIMSAYRAHEKWRVISEDWGADIGSIEIYLLHHDDLVKEGLPLLQDRFVTKLNQDSTQSLASIRQKLYSEHEEIRDRIDIINDVLNRTEFRDGTYLKLVGQKEEYEHVKEFNRKITRVLSMAANDDPMDRFEGVREIVSIIENASIISPKTDESKQLLEPRYQLRFIAEEIRRSDLKRVDILTSSSGKSGGEKESFAGIVVAASLAYVLTPDGFDKPVYSTVFLDEAFSNTSEMVSRRVLRVFKELNIHINLITPYKNLNIARESANSLLIAERDAESHESRFTELTWEEVDRRLKEVDEDAADAEELGIELEGT